MNSPPHPHAPETAGADSYTAEEIHALKGIFALYDPDKTGSIPFGELEVKRAAARARLDPAAQLRVGGGRPTVCPPQSLLEKIGYTGDSKQDILAAAKGRHPLHHS